MGWRPRVCVLVLVATAHAQAPSANSPDLYDAAKQLFDQYAPPEVKAQYDFPSREQFRDFLTKLQQAIDSGSLEQLGEYSAQARALLPMLRASPEFSAYADWLGARLDELEAAQQLSHPAVPARPPAPTDRVPYFDSWMARVRGRPQPPAAAELMPILEKAFAAEGVPPQLAWVAEAESSFNPEASSPAGAKGLFQLKSETAKSLGLSTFFPDERTDPEKSARAAARELRRLHERFGSWPLALAAYNAGQGRVSRLLASRRASDYAQIAGALPGETRMYVPKVCALVAVRTGWRAF